MDLDRRSTSALVKRLRESSRARPRSMGFGRLAEEAPSSPALVLIAEVDGCDGAAAAAAVASGATSVLFTLAELDISQLSSGNLEPLRLAVASCGDAVPGVMLGSDIVIEASLPALLSGLKIDFLIGSIHQLPASILEDESIARIPRVEASQPMAIIRSFADLSVDAVAIGPSRRRRNTTPGLSFYDVIAYKQAVDATRLPAIIIGDAPVNPGDLQTLRNLGVEGIVVPLRSLGTDPTEAATALEPFRDAIKVLKIVRKSDRREESTSAISMPRALGANKAADHDDEEDDDDGA